MNYSALSLMIGFLLSTGSAVFAAKTERPIRTVESIAMGARHAPGEEGAMKPMLRTISFTYKNEFNPFCNKTEARLQFTIVKKPLLEKRKLISRGTIVVSLVDRLIRKLDRPCIEPVFPRKVFEVFLNSGGAQGIETLDSQLVKYLGLKSQADLWSADRKLKYLLIFPMVTDVFGQSIAY